MRDHNVAERMAALRSMRMSLVRRVLLCVFDHSRIFATLNVTSTRHSPQFIHFTNSSLRSLSHSHTAQSVARLRAFLDAEGDCAPLEA